MDTSKRKETASKTLTPRRGRPPREMAGEVEDRIVNAALKVFIARGYEGASIDEIAEVARAGKPSIYARFTGKETLFREVVLRWSQKTTENIPSCGDGDIEKRFQAIALMILQNAVSEEKIGLMRSVIAEATRHPELATTIHYAMREHGTATMMKLVSDIAESDAIRCLPAFAPGNLVETTRRFIDIVLLPIMVSSLFHADLTPVREQLENHACKAASFFLKGCGYRPQLDTHRAPEHC
ncbi:TetR/AcrR family transcriptional regulator [Allorhizobium sp. BGMRC 0089]|uniref:TetR/AcrR family transcriptional regulator n=1 Tax=Allorhizobium sonneratiae TaxID=2934936 RepID=UPI00203330B3|nr:TetR/AcrR family transcriptional regulator [Allorhizobium sonneratiae]MCM2292906.1 TetR/AcrR family transcriptional regulator [Allorhizobium sonneratiae]